MAAKNKARRKWIPIILIGLGCFAVSLIIAATRPFETLELKVTDFLFEIRGPLDTSNSPIVLVAISDQADSELEHKWPWPTSYHARLVENLNRAGAKVIVFDVLFNQFDDFDIRNDSLFAHAMKEHGNVVLAGNLQVDRIGTGGSQSIQLVQPNRLFMEYNPNPWGFVSVNTDSDGFLRKYLMSRSHLGRQYYSFGLEAIRHFKELDSLSVTTNNRYFDLGFTQIPRISAREMQINFHGGPKSFPEYSYEQIIDDKDFITISDREFFGIESPDDKDFGTFDDPDFGLLYTDIFKDKIVLVGATMLELQDYYSTPFAPNRAMPGYEAHANAIQTILTENYLYGLSNQMRLLLVFMVVLIVVLTGIFFDALYGFLATSLYSVILVLGVIWAFISFNLIVPLIAPLLALAVSYTSAVVWNFVKEQKEKSRIKGMFGTYVSPELVNNMIESGEEPKLGGDEVYISAFFSDIQSFSAFSEQLQPSQLVELLNEYLNEMTGILTSERGTLDKYIGDAIVAFFGAPVPVEDHALRACVTSQRMLLKQKELREKWASEGDKWPALVSKMQTRIGINTGLMVTGNMGSQSRFNYTMMGDNVNLAARCESGAKAYGVYTMVTEDTKKEAQKFGDECLFRHLDKIVVMGRSKPVDIYEVAALRSQAEPQLIECVECFEAALSEYQKQNWHEAISLFESSAKLEPNQPDRKKGIKTNPSLVLLDRCREMKVNPPGDDWNGVYIMKSK